MSSVKLLLFATTLLFTLGSCDLSCLAKEGCCCCHCAGGNKCGGKVTITQHYTHTSSLFANTHAVSHVDIDATHGF